MCRKYPFELISLGIQNAGRPVNKGYTHKHFYVSCVLIGLFATLPFFSFAALPS
jgi:hypothetical protein